MRIRRTTCIAAALAVGVLLAIAAPASAHVTVRPLAEPHDGFVTVAFQVPNEKDAAATTKFEVVFPDHPALTSASVQPLPGWTSTITRDADRVASITWTGGRIAPDQFQQFDVSLGGVPADAQALTFKALQTYDDGEIVRWIDIAAGDEEGGHPAPVLTLTATTTAGDSRPVGPAYGLAAAALALSVLAFARSRKQHTA